MKLHIPRLSLILVLSLFVSACATAPAKDSGYLMNAEALVDSQARYPFQRVWFEEMFMQGPSAYKKLYVAPVNTDYIKTMAWYEQLTAEAKVNIQLAADNLAIYMHDKFEQEFVQANIPNLKLLDESNDIDSNTLVLELAIVELVPSPAQVNRLSSAAGFFVPFLGVAKSLVVQDGSIAIEGRFSNGVSKQELMLFADREEDNSALVFDVSDFTYFRHARKNIDTWANQIVKVVLSDPDKVVQDKKLKLKPW